MARRDSVAFAGRRPSGRRRLQAWSPRGGNCTPLPSGSCGRWRYAGPSCGHAPPLSSSSSRRRFRAWLRCCTRAARSSATNVDKGDTFARTYLATGTYGFIPGHPSAYTQPLYGWFLIPLYWIFGRHWEVVGLAQILVAVGTTLVVWQIGRRWLTPTIGFLAGLASHSTRTSSGTTCT